MSKIARPATAVALLGALAIALAGCSGAGSNGSSVTQETPMEKAVEAFGNEAAACDSADSALTADLATAATDVKTKPAALEAPADLGALSKAITAAQAVTACTPPKQSKNLATLRQQTKDLTASTTAVQAAVTTLQQSDEAVTSSVAAKQTAVAAAQAAAEARARTWNINAGNGYTYTVVLSAGSLTAGTTSTGETVGAVCTDYDPKTDLAVPYTLTVTSTTKNFTIPKVSVDVFPYGFGQVQLLDGAWSIGNAFTATEGGQYEAEEYYSSNSNNCWQPAQSDESGLLNVQWSSGLKPGQSSIWPFTFIVKGYKSPKYPNGDSRLLSGIGLSTQLAVFWINGDKAVLLNNHVVGG